MPASAERTRVGAARASHAGDQRGVEGVALRGVAPLAGALAFALLGRGFLHATGHLPPGATRESITRPAGKAATTGKLWLSGRVAPVNGPPFSS